MGYLGAWGKLLNEKTWSGKSRVRLPLNTLLVCTVKDIVGGRQSIEQNMPRIL